MQVTTTAFIIISLLTGTISSSAQCTEPDVLPGIPSPHHRVENLTAFKVAPVPVLDSGEYIDVTLANNIITTALKYRGARYARGSMGPRSFDCSGFTSYVFKENNISLLRSSRSQYTQGVAVSRSDLQVGDLVFFSGSRHRSVIGHVGIVSSLDENGTGFSFIHASRKGVVITKSSEPYYSARYVGARRIINT